MSENMKTTPGRPSGLTVAAEAAGSAPDASEEVVHPRVALLMVICAFVLFGGALSLLYYRWFTVSVPKTMVRVVGDDSFDGATVRITGPMLADDRFKVVLDRQNAHVARFYVEPNNLYTVIAEQPGHETLKMMHAMGAAVYEVSLLKLRSASTQPTSRRVEHER